MQPLEELTAEGQSVWLDFIRRDHTRSGRLAALVDSGVRGVTSNPSIFQQAIGGSEAYDTALSELLDEDPDRTPLQLFEAVAIVDIQEAADALRSVYDASGGDDGYVSLEVSPTLADDAEGTIREARRLWTEVDRPNLMIKVPATAPGVAAFEQLTAEGINVNVTLMFSLQHYEDVAQAYLRGLRRAADPAGIASVASFFVSRVDSAVDGHLDEIGTDEAAALRGTAAVANAKLAYRRYEELFEGAAFADLAARGARPQRVLWASTSTKDESYSDVKYVEELVGSNTVNTIPPTTLDAFIDHGKARSDMVEEDVDGAAAAIAGLASVGIDFGAITDRLQVDGVASFAAAFQDMLDTIAEKSDRLLAASVDAPVMRLGDLGPVVEDELARWDGDDRVARLWAKDHTVWVDEPEAEIADRLGWLELPRSMRAHVEDITWFVDAVRADEIRDVVLLGMGGSSLAPDVFSRSFGPAQGFPRLTVLDSTHPDAVRAVTEAIDPAATLFVVASKSGTTIEPLSFFHHFWAIAADAVDDPGTHFVAITDPGTPLAELGAERGFRMVFEAIPDVGGRYSALTHFGLVPAALIGVDIGLLLDQALRMAAASVLPASRNPAVRLGVTLGAAVRGGRDKATFVVSPSFEGLPDWLEQLVAESTGKDGTGIVPIAGEEIGDPDAYGPDRVFVSVSLRADGEPEEELDALAAAGHPVVRIVADRLEDLAGEMFRAEVAVAAAGSVLGIHPFDQPDVQEAKELARRAMAGDLDTGDIATVEAGESVHDLEQFLSGIGSGDYVALQVFAAPTPEADAAMARLRHLIRDRHRVATTVGFGPRFLHSTGQLHKGGADNGVFVQFIDRPSTDLSVPEQGHTFGELIAAQADGDYRALLGAGRRILRIQLGAEPVSTLEALIAAMEQDH